MNNTNTASWKENWRAIWNTAIAKFQVLGGTALLIILLAILPHFFNAIEARKGVVLNDWVLDHIPAHNVSIAIFSLIWGMAALIFFRALKKPAMYVTYIWAYSFIILVRFVTITCIKLDPPTGLIQLTDPLTGIFYGHANITKDLFFSGHTATLCLIYLTLEKRVDKIIGFIAATAVGILLLVQHIHYTLDVIVAPIATYPIYRVTVLMLRQGKKRP